MNKLIKSKMRITILKKNTRIKKIKTIFGICISKQIVSNLEIDSTKMIIKCTSLPSNVSEQIERTFGTSDLNSLNSEDITVKLKNISRMYSYYLHRQNISKASIQANILAELYFELTTRFLKSEK